VWSRLVLLFLLVAMATPLGACGRRGALEEPEGATYPHTYPTDYNAPEDDPNDKKK